MVLASLPVDAMRPAGSLLQSRAMATRRHKLEASKVLTELIRKLLSISDPDELLVKVIALAREFVGADLVTLFLVDGGDLVEHVTEGKSLKRNQRRIKIGQEGLTGWSAGRRKSVIVPDVKKDKRYVEG